MPILSYFVVMGSALFAILIAVSAYLEPEKASSPSEFLGVRQAQANEAPVIGSGEAFFILKGRPLR